MSDAANLNDLQSRLDTFLQRREKELKEEASFLKVLLKRFEGRSDGTTTASATSLVSRSIKELTKGSSR